MRRLVGDPVNRADAKASYAAAANSAEGHTPRRVWDPPMPGGWAGWKVGDVLIVTRALRPGSPARVRRAYRDRLVATATGRCPRCGACASFGDGLPVELSHEDDCPAARLDPRWLVPEEGDPCSST